jgi:hypothetical protein
MIEECCGMHLVCEKETLLQPNPEIIYYDDEELDTYIGRPAESYSAAETEQFAYILHTMLEKDVAGWVRSLQLRNISLPLSVRDEALLIVREQRTKA